MFFGTGSGPCNDSAVGAEENKALIARFYTAFAERDGAAMAACYVRDAHFSDPVFTDLVGPEPGAMWRMLTSRGEDLEVELVDHAASEDSGTAHWIATYTFTQTGRHVVNDVHAHFRFRDGLISDHMDDFNFYKWSKQALGTPGLLLGWTPIIHGAVKKKARAGLDEFLAASA
jgi:ketosteroid isomerase-like protein